MTGAGMQPRILVAGAGAAGLMAAIAAARAGADVLAVERTHDGGRKILISGGGRCNVLPAALEPQRFVTASSPNTLRNLLRSWPLDAQRRFFEEEARVPLALEEETRKYFPVSNRARDVRDALVALARRLGVTFRFGDSVVNLAPPQAGAAAAADVMRGRGPWLVSLDSGERLEASAVVMASGGLSVPSTGSDGQGLAILRALGLTIHETYPALTPLVADPPVHAPLAGVSLPVTLRVAGTPAAAGGGFLFTHRGYSGPAVLDLSHHAVRGRDAPERPRLLVQWTPRDAQAWEEDLRQTGGLVLARVRAALPERLALRLLEEAEIPRDRTLAELRREDRRRLIDLLCSYPLPWTGDEGYRKAEVTGGGVALDEVDPRTMESRRHPGLFLCGELLDAFGPIGGHNFAWAWATGRLAGLGAAGAVTRA